MPKGVTYNQTQYNAAEAIADALKASGGIPVETSARPTIAVLTGTLSSSGDTTLIAAPGAGIAINIAYLKIQLEAATSTIVIIKSGSSARERIFCTSQGDGLIVNFFPNRELRLDANTALIVNLSGANTINYTFHYFTTS